MLTWGGRCRGDRGTPRKAGGYRETLDAPIPALDGKSPRQAVRTSAGREKVIDWLKHLENRSVGHAEGPIAEYDFRWIWAELGLQEYRR